MKLLHPTLKVCFVPTLLRTGQHSLHLGQRQGQPRSMSTTLAAKQASGKHSSDDAKGSGKALAAPQWTAFGDPFMSPTLQQFISKSWFSDQIIQATTNMETILGISQENVLQFLWMDKTELMYNQVAAWASINEASDLYLPDLGEFDVPQVYGMVVKTQEANRKLDILSLVPQSTITAAYNECCEPADEKAVAVNTMKSRLTHENPDLDIDQWMLNHLIAKGSNRKDQPSNTHKIVRQIAYNTAWLVDAKELQFEGYFGATCRADGGVVTEANRQNVFELLGADGECPTRQHFLQHKDAWCAPANMATMPELLTRTRRRKAGEGFLWPEDADNMDPARLVDTIRNIEWGLESGENRLYSHLDTFQDSGRIRVIRSDLQLAKASKALKVDGLQFADQAHQQTLLVYTMHDAADENTLIGMAGIDHERAKVSTDCDFGDAPPDIVTQLSDFHRSFAEWAETAYGVGGDVDEADAES